MGKSVRSFFKPPSIKSVKKTFKEGGIGAVVGKIDPLRGGDVILDKVGLPNLLGPEKGMLGQTARDNAAAELQKAELEQQEQYALEQQRRLEQQNEQALRDANTDLGLENVADIRAGDAAQTSSLGGLRKKRKGNSLSQALGLGL